MALRRIENIKIGEFPAGTAFGAYVYNANINVGMNGEPTTLEVDLVNESGMYPITKGDLNAVSPRSVKFGNLASTNPKDFIFLKSMFLVNFSYNQGVGQKTLKLKFVCGASVLDKIQVLLLNKQVTPLNMVGKSFGVWDFKARSFSVPIQCNNKCDRTQAPPWGSNSVNPWSSEHVLSFGEARGAGRSGKEVVIPGRVANAMVTNVNPTNLAYGGAIILGEEEFTSSNCQIPNISYTFEELSNIIQNFLGIPMIGFRDRGRIKREAFTGSLKEVLNQWCGMYGYSFSWDYVTNSLLAVDLQNPNLLSLQPIYELVRATKEGSMETPVAISDVTRDFSIENTYRQDNISSFIKPAKTKSTRNKINRIIRFKPFNIFNLIPEAQFLQYSGGRTPEEFITSCVLSKFNANARTLYNYYLIANKTSEFTNLADLNSGLGSPLGMSLRAILSPVDKAKLISYTMSIEQILQNNKKYGANSAIGIGTYSKEWEDKWVEWEKGVADFIGKYYYFPEIAQESFVCNVTQQLKYIKEVSTKPATEVFSRAYQASEEFPFSKLLLHPDGIQKLNLIDKYGNQFDRFHLYQRNPAYGTNVQEFNEMFYEKGEDLLKDYLPSFTEMDGNQRLFLDHLMKRVFPLLYTNVEEITKENKRPKMLYLPSAANILNIFNVTSLKGTPGWRWTYNPPDGLGNSPFTSDPANFVNQKEYKPKNSDEEKTCEGFVCEQDIINWLCRCPEDDSYNPDNVGLTNVNAQSFGVSVNRPVKGKIAKTIILPSESPYQGYITITEEISQTIRAIMQNFGILTNAQGTMGYKVDTQNITSDIDAIEDADKAGSPVADNHQTGQIKSHVMVPGKGKMAAVNYHNATDTSHTSSFVNETLSFTMMGLDFGLFCDYISIQNGLRSLSLSLDESGTRISVSLSTAPPALPKVENFLPRMEARLNSNSYLRTY